MLSISTHDDVCTVWIIETGTEISTIVFYNRLNDGLLGKVWSINAKITWTSWKETDFPTNVRRLVCKRERGRERGKERKRERDRELIHVKSQR